MVARVITAAAVKQNKKKQQQQWLKSVKLLSASAERTVKQDSIFAQFTATWGSNFARKQMATKCKQAATKVKKGFPMNIPDGASCRNSTVFNFCGRFENHCSPGVFTNEFVNGACAQNKALAVPFRTKTTRHHTLAKFVNGRNWTLLCMLGHAQC